MKKWTRWEDWVAIAAGLAVALSTMFVAPMISSQPFKDSRQAALQVSISFHPRCCSTFGRGLVNTPEDMVTLGVLLVASGVVNLAFPGLVAMEYVQGALGLLLIVIPLFQLPDTMTSAAAWVSWICGAIVVVVAALAIRPSMRAHHDAITH